MHPLSPPDTRPSIITYDGGVNFHALAGIARAQNGRLLADCRVQPSGAEHVPRATARNNISFNPSLHRVSTFIANVITIARTSTRAQYSRGESQGLILHIPPLLLGQINITAAAALDSKADLGLALPPIHWSESRLKAFGKGLGLVRGAWSGYCALGGATPGRRLG